MSRSTVNLIALDLGAEEWRAIPGTPEYQASSFGRIRRVKASRGTRPGKLLTQTPDIGYFKVSVSRDSKARRVWVHRLVALAFHGAPSSPLLEVAHGDNDGSNNLPANLRWATRAENAADRLIHGTARIGEAAHGAKLDSSKVLAIRARLAAGATRREMAALFSVSPTTIDDIATGRTWRHVK